MAVKKAEFLAAMRALKEIFDELYVHKDGAKVLSTNDFTDELKAKLEGIIDEEITAEDIRNAIAGDNND